MCSLLCDIISHELLQFHTVWKLIYDDPVDGKRDEISSNNLKHSYLKRDSKGLE